MRPCDCVCTDGRRCNTTASLLQVLIRAIRINKGAHSVCLHSRQETVLRLWDVTRGKLECATAATRDREAEMEGFADRHAMELKVAHRALSCHDVATAEAGLAGWRVRANVQAVR